MSAPGPQAKILVEAFGETKTIRQWAEDERCRVPKTTLRERLSNGWAPEQAITEPRRPVTAPRSSKRIDEALDLYKQGASTREIARKIGVTSGTVHGWLDEAGFADRTTRRHARSLPDGPVHPVVEELRERRHRAGIPSEDLSKRLGWGNNTVSDYERGESGPSLDRVTVWAAALGVRLVLLPEDGAVVSRGRGLSPRQRQVLLCLARGLGAEGIAADLGISPGTARDYLKSLYKSLGVNTASHAVTVGIVEGHITVSDLRAFLATGAAAGLGER